MAPMRLQSEVCLILISMYLHRHDLPNTNQQYPPPTTPLAKSPTIAGGDRDGGGDQLPVAGVLPALEPLKPQASCHLPPHPPLLPLGPTVPRPLPTKHMPSA